MLTCMKNSRREARHISVPTGKWTLLSMAIFPICVIKTATRTHSEDSHPQSTSGCTSKAVALTTSFESQHTAGKSSRNLSPAGCPQSHMITVHSQETRHTPSSSVRVSHCPLGWGSVSTLHCFRVNKSKFLKFLWFVKYLQWDKKW